MSKKKTTQTSQSTQANTFGQIKPEETADTQAIRDWKPMADPSISYAFGRAQNAIRDSFNNPLGADTPAAVKDAIERASYGQLGQAEAAVRGDEAFRNNSMDLSRRMYLDERTAPRIVQTGGTSSGTSTYQEKATPFGVLTGIGSAALSF